MWVVCEELWVEDPSQYLSACIYIIVMPKTSRKPPDGLSCEAEVSLLSRV